MSEALALSIWAGVLIALACACGVSARRALGVGDLYRADIWIVATWLCGGIGGLLAVVLALSMRMGL